MSPKGKDDMRPGRNFWTGKLLIEHERPLSWSRICSIGVPHDLISFSCAAFHPSRGLNLPRLTQFFLIHLHNTAHFHGLGYWDLDTSLQRISIAPRGLWTLPGLLPELSFQAGLTKSFLSMPAFRTPALGNVLMSTGSSSPEVSERLFLHRLGLAAVLGCGCLPHTSSFGGPCSWEQVLPLAETRPMALLTLLAIDGCFLLSEQNQFSIPDILIGI